METVGEETRPKACSSEAKENDSGEKTLEETSLLKLNQDVSDEEEEEEEYEYHEGDFVWGKVKNHPWWPGQIYHPSEASDLALKIKQKEKGKGKQLLVAYFGDGSFAWCAPSQLKPFAESFKECCSNSRGFAVREAVEEMGRHVERCLLIGCEEEEEEEKKQEVKNAGIKEGVVVRDVRREVVSALLVGKPQGLLEDVKGFAETVSFSGLLELEIVKRKVSAFYRSKRGYGLTEFPEPQSVPGLEDKNNDDDDDDDGGGAKRSTIEKGKEEEEEEKEEEALDLEKRPLKKCSWFPDHRLQHRRKQKSIAEILKNESSAKVRFEIEPEDGKGKSSSKKMKRSDEVKGELALVTTTTTPRSRRMKEVATLEEEDSKCKTFSRKRKKRDEDGSEDREEAEKKDGSEDEEDKDSTPLASLRKKVKVDASRAGNGEASTQTTTKRVRKKSKYFAPEYLSDFPSKGRKKSRTEPESSIVPSQSQAGELMANASSSHVVVEEDNFDKPCEVLLLENGVGHQELSEELTNAVEFLRLGATTEEIGDLIRVSALGTEYPQDSSSRDMVKEFMSIFRSFTYHEGANSKFLGSYSTVDTDMEEVNGTSHKTADTVMEEVNGTGKPEEIEQTGKEENETDKHEPTKKERKPMTPSSKKQADEEEETLKYPNARAEEKKAEAAETTIVGMEHLKKKLEKMISLVDKSEGRMSEQVKVKLEVEMVNLLEKVRKMPLS